MKLSIITIFCLFISITVNAQISTSISTSTGYESNINRLPNSYLSKGKLKGKEYLYQSSLYQEGVLKLSYKNAWENNEFRVYFNPEIKYYFSESSSKRILLNTRLKYSNSISKKMKWETNVIYKMREQEGQDLDEPELNTPRGYNLSSLNTGLRIRLYKNNRTYLRANYDIKSFDKSETREMMYHRYGVYGKFEHRSGTHHLGVMASFLNRNYQFNYFTKNKTKTRTWQYLKGGIYYRFPLDNHFQLEPSVSYEKRTDITQNKYGYSQIRPGLAFLFKTQKLSASLKTSYTIRNFDVLQASSTKQKNIGNMNYNYTRIKFAGSYQLFKNLEIVSDMYLLDRKTNNTNLNTKSYRSYTNYYAGAGFRYKL